MKRPFWWYRPSPVVLVVAALLLVFAFRALAQAAGAPDPVDVSTPPETILPGLPASWQYAWVYYVVPIFTGLHMIMLGVSHMPQAQKPGTPLARLVTWWFSGAKAAARMAHIQLPEDEKNIAIALKTEAPAQPKPPAASGFARLGLLSTIAVLALVFLPACASFGSAQGSTGKVDLGKDVSCVLTLGATDPTTCTKPVTNVCTVPDLKDSAGNCTSVGLDTGSLNLGKGYSCRATVAPAATPCFATVTTSCVLPVTKNPDGSCPQ